MNDMSGIVVLRASEEGKMKEYVIVTGGGTAGHINPAIAIAKALVNEGYEVLYVGSDGADCLDRKLVERSGLPFLGLKIVTPLLRVSLQTVSSIFSLMRATAKCKRMMKRKRPSFVIGTGGFVSIPVLNAALSLGVGTAIHEQNVFPGITNRRLSAKVDKVFMTFADSLKYLKCEKDKAILTGVPLVHPPSSPSEEEYAQRIGKEFRILVSGGSLGSKFLNEVTVGAAEMIQKTGEPIYITLSCGRDYYEEMKGFENSHLSILPYIFDMPTELYRSDLMVCRAGSSTVFEGIASRIPAIVVPSPNVAGDHQRPNARYWEKSGAAIYAEESDLTAEHLASTILNLYHNKEEAVRMKRSAAAVETPNALDVIVAELRNLR